jgi:hypothetical protein
MNKKTATSYRSFFLLIGIFYGMLFPSLLQATPPGYDPYGPCDQYCTCKESSCPQPCPWCQPPTPNSAISYSEGNFADTYHVLSLKSAFGPTIDLSLTYNSYNADGSRANVDTVLGERCYRNASTHTLRKSGRPPYAGQSPRSAGPLVCRRLI